MSKMKFWKEKKKQAHSPSVIRVSQLSLLFCSKIIVQVFQTPVASVSRPASPKRGWAETLVLHQVRFCVRAGKHCERHGGTSPNLPGVLLQFFLSSVFSSLFPCSKKNYRNPFNVTFFFLPPFHVPAAYQRDQMQKSQNPRIWGSH